MELEVDSILRHAMQNSKRLLIGSSIGILAMAGFLVTQNIGTDKRVAREHIVSQGESSAPVATKDESAIAYRNEVLQQETHPPEVAREVNVPQPIAQMQPSAPQNTSYDYVVERLRRQSESGSQGATVLLERVIELRLGFLEAADDPEWSRPTEAELYRYLMSQVGSLEVSSIVCRGAGCELQLSIDNSDTTNYTLALIGMNEQIPALKVRMDVPVPGGARNTVRLMYVSRERLPKVAP